MKTHLLSVALVVCGVALVNGAPSGGIITMPLIPHHVHVQRRRHLESGRRRESTQLVGGLYEGYGTHYVDLWVGTPPQRQTVIVDTGSSVTAFPCTGCENCGAGTFHIDPLFDTNASSTFQSTQCSARGNQCKSRRSTCNRHNNQCDISMRYAEGSTWGAYEATDRCYFGGPHDVPLVPIIGTKTERKEEGKYDDMDPNHADSLSADLTFGCQTRMTIMFQQQLADGIMGMDRDSGSYWSQLYSQGKIGNKKFSLCFSRPPTVTRTGTQAGAMTLGGHDPRLHRDPSPAGMVYTTGASQGKSGFYNVKLRNMYLRSSGGGESAQSTRTEQTEGVLRINVDIETLNRGGIIVDSGTTDTYWDRGIAQAFSSAYEHLTGKPYHNVVASTEVELTALPTILFQIQTNERANAAALNSTGGDANKVVGLTGDLDPAHPNDVLVAFPPSHYMEYSEGKSHYVARFSTSEYEGSLMGANVILGHDVLFDVDADRIGWAESSCDYAKVLKDGGFDDPLSGKDSSNQKNGVEKADEQNENVSNNNVDEPNDGDSNNKDAQGKDGTEDEANGTKKGDSEEDIGAQEKDDIGDETDDTKTGESNDSDAQDEDDSEDETDVVKEGESKEENDADEEEDVKDEVGVEEDKTNPIPENHEHTTWTDLDLSSCSSVRCRGLVIFSAISFLIIASCIWCRRRAAGYKQASTEDEMSNEDSSEVEFCDEASSNADDANDERCII